MPPIVKSIKTENGPHYSQCKSTVVFDMPDGSELEVVYPVQGPKHMIMLMKNAETGRNIDHQTKLLLYDIIVDRMQRMDA
jgi:hypothetical protein